jgi:hypothetical protein
MGATDAAASSDTAGMPCMYDCIDTVATAWLPEDLSTNIRNEEQSRFENLVRAVESVAEAVPDENAACAKQDALLEADPFLAQIHT